MATIQDVAEKVGITKGVVSAYLNDAETSRVSSATKQKIDLAIAELGYVRNVHARNLSNRRSNLINVLVLFREPLFRNSVVNEILSGAGLVLSSFGYGLAFSAQGSGSLLEMAKGQIRNHHGNDGYLVIGTRYGSDADIEDTIDELELRKAPFVIANMTELSRPVNQVLFNVDASAAAIRTLYDLGHRQILVLGGTGNDPRGDYEMDLVRSTLRDLGVSQDDEYYHYGEYEFRPAKEVVLRVLDEGLKFTAVFTLTRQMAMGASQALTERGVNVPGDVTISTFAETRFLDYYHFPFIVTARDYFRMGQEAARLLTAEIESRAAGRPHRPQSVRLDSRLVFSQPVPAITPSQDVQ